MKTDHGISSLYNKPHTYYISIVINQMGSKVLLCDEASS